MEAIVDKIDDAITMQAKMEQECQNHISLRMWLNHYFELFSRGLLQPEDYVSACVARIETYKQVDEQIKDKYYDNKENGKDE